MSKFIIFGGDGFLGRYLAKELLKQNKKVLICDINKTADIYPRADFCKVDITNLEELKNVNMLPDDIIINLAARQYHVKVPRKNRREFFFAVNYTGTANILKIMEQNNAHQLIYFSTDMTYGRPKYLPVDNKHPQEPFGPYGESKKASEKLCFKYREKGFNITIFRPRMILGPGRLGILKKLFKLIGLGLPIPLIGSGTNCYQMVSVFDCVSAIVAAIDKKIPNKEYNLGLANPPTVKNLLSKVISEVKSNSILVPTNGRLVKMVLALLGSLGIELLYKEQYEISDENYIVDISNTMEELNWTPKFDDTDMLYQAYEYYKQENL